VLRCLRSRYAFAARSASASAHSAVGSVGGSAGAVSSEMPSSMTTPHLSKNKTLRTASTRRSSCSSLMRSSMQRTRPKRFSSSDWTSSWPNALAPHGNLPSKMSHRTALLNLTATLDFTSASDAIAVSNMSSSIATSLPFRRLFVLVGW